MQASPKPKAVTQFRGLHAMSATAASSSAEKPKRTNVPTSNPRLPQAPQRNAA